MALYQLSEVREERGGYAAQAELLRRLLSPTRGTSERATTS